MPYNIDPPTLAVLLFIIVIGAGSIIVRSYWRHNTRRMLDSRLDQITRADQERR